MKTVPLGEVATWGSGGTPKRGVATYFGPGVPWLSIADLNDGLVDSARESLTIEGIANSAAKVVPPGTIFIAMYGSIGKLGIAGREMTTSQAIAFAKPDTTVVDPRYLFQFLLSQRPQFQARGRGGTQMNIGQADLKSWPIPLPPLEEQRRIAAMLDQADALRAKRRQALAHLDSLTQSIFHDMFGDPAHWAATWPMSTIGDLSSSVNYGTSAKASRSGSWPILRMGNVTDDGRIDETDLKFIDLAPDEVRKFTAEKGDLLFNRTNSKEKVGKAAVIRSGARVAYAGYLVRVRFRNQGAAEFVSSYLRSGHGRSLRQRLAKAAVNQANINASELARISIASPPSDTLQAFNRAIVAIEARRADDIRALHKTDQLFASLQSRAFRGEL